MFCSQCGAQTNGSAFCSNCGVATNSSSQPQQNSQSVNVTPAKSRITGGILGILLGGLGIHKFYMGKIGAGIVYILLCWTYIPAIVGLVEGIIYLVGDDAAFDAKVRDGKFF